MYGENPGLITICKLVTSSLHTAFSHSSNKKKVRLLSSRGLAVAPTDVAPQFSQAFMTSYIERWLNFISNEGAVCLHTRTEMRDPGVELLFNADSLKQIAEGPRTAPLFHCSTTHLTLILKPSFTHHAPIPRHGCLHRCCRRNAAQLSLQEILLPWMSTRWPCCSSSLVKKSYMTSET